MIRWMARYPRMIVVLGAIASFLVASGAGARWGSFLD
jgi:hypothetical protein